MSREQNVGQPVWTGTLRDAVRLRTGMYFGTDDSYALYLMLCTVLDHSVNEAYLGTCNRINITFHDGNAVTVRDNGQGLPVETDPETNRPGYPLSPMEYAGNMNKPKYQFQASRYIHVLAVINAASQRFEAVIKRNGYVWEQRFAEGVPTSELGQLRPLRHDEPTGTEITFSPDFSIFKRTEFDHPLIVRRLREIAYLIPGLIITVEDRRAGAATPVVELSSAGGVSDYMRYLNRDYRVLHEPITIKKTVALRRDYKLLGYSGTFDIALQYADVHQPIMLSFMNGFEIECQGPPIEGLIEALHGTIVRKAQAIEPRREFDGYDYTDDDVLCGLAVVISMQHPKPDTRNAIYYILANTEVKDAVESLVDEAITAFAKTYPDQMQRIVENCLANKQRRLQRRYGE